MGAKNTRSTRSTKSTNKFRRGRKKNRRRLESKRGGMEEVSYKVPRMYNPTTAKPLAPVPMMNPYDVLNSQSTIKGKMAEGNFKKMQQQQRLQEALATVPTEKVFNEPPGYYEEDIKEQLENVPVLARDAARMADKRNKRRMREELDKLTEQFSRDMTMKAGNKKRRYTRKHCKR